MKLITCLLFVFSACFGFSQNLEKIAENKLDIDTKVFTYKVQNSAPSGVTDNQTVQNLTNTEQENIAYFMKQNGVKSATFDKATNTYTVVTKVSTKLPTNINLD
jgi:hypothetical protein